MPNKSWGVIAVGTRLEKGVEAGFFTSWSNLLLKGLRRGDVVLMVKGKVAHVAANYLATAFLKTKADSLLFIDSDAEFDPDILEKMRNDERGWKYDVLQAFYTRRGWPPEPIWMKQDSAGRFMLTVPESDNDVEDLAVAGLHFTLVRRKVIETMLDARDVDIDKEDFQWFTYPRHKQMSEDAFFSGEVRKHGFSIGGTTAVRVGHIGQIITGWDTFQEWYEISGTKDRTSAFENLVWLVSGFLQKSYSDVLEETLEGGKRTARKWNEANPETLNQVHAFYGTDAYLYDLISWNTTPFYSHIVEPLSRVSGKKCLVIGAGLGNEVAALMESNLVDVFELPGQLREFLSHRFKHKSLVNIMDEPILSKALAGKSYDLVVAIDTIEHFHPDEFHDAMQAIMDSIESGGVLYCHNNFEEKTPMAHNYSEEFDWLMSNNGFTQTGAYSYGKTESFTTVS